MYNSRKLLDKINPTFSLKSKSYNLSKMLYRIILSYSSLDCHRWNKSAIIISFAGFFFWNWYSTCISHIWYFLFKFSGYKYAGLQASTWCTCGNLYGKHGRAANSECNMGCSAAPGVKCGGIWRNSIYEISLPQQKEVLVFHTPKLMRSWNL